MPHKTPDAPTGQETPSIAPSEQVALFAMANHGATAYRELRREGVQAAMFQSAVGRSVFEAARRLEEERPGDWKSGDLYFRANRDFPSTMAELNAMFNTTPVPLPRLALDSRAVGQAIVQAYRRSRTEEAAKSLLSRLKNGGDWNEELGRLVEVGAGGSMRRRLSYFTGGENDERDEAATYHLCPVLIAGQVTSVVGAGGTGKTKVVIHWIGAAIAGSSFGDFKNPEILPGGHWLYVGGNENSKNRLLAEREDVCRFHPEAADEIRRRLVFQYAAEGDTVLDADALDLVEEKLRELAETPDGLAGVVFDPLSDFSPRGESLNEDACMKGTVVRLREMVRRVCPVACIVLIHHSRGGRAAFLSALDPFDAGEFGRNSKMLAFTSRCSVNIVPYLYPGSVVLKVAKCNNDAWTGKPFAMLFDAKAGGYVEDEYFDLEAFRAKLAEDSSKPKKPKPAKKDSDGDKPTPPPPKAKDDGAALKAFLEIGESVTWKELYERTASQGGNPMAKSSFSRKLKAATEDGWLAHADGVYRRER
jgi:hypothetical protein